MNRLLCYAHYDEKGDVSDFVKHALNSMAVVCSEIRFVSNSPLPEHEKRYLEKSCRHVIVNDNTGYDFHMWKTALGIVDYAGFDEIVLMNSSVYGPITPIEPVFAEMASRRCDFWGITECFQMRPHVQSYFLVFRKRVITSAQFAMFWNGVLPYENKNQVVMSYEIGLTQWLVESDFERGVYCNLHRLADFAQRNGTKVKLKDDPSRKHAVQLLRIGVPFLKREFVRRNAGDLRFIEAHLANSNYPVDFIKDQARDDEHACPVCGANGKLHYRNVRDKIDVYNTGSYDYFRCINRKCKALWLSHLPEHDPYKFIFGNYATNGNTDLSGAAGSPKQKFPVSIVLKIMKKGLQWLKIDKKRASYDLYQLDKVPPGNLLEIGSGNGKRLVRLRELGWHVVGQENDDDLLRRLQEKNIRTVKGRAGLDSLEQCQFDIVLLTHAVAKACDYKSLLSVCHRLLKPGGKVCLTTPNMNAINHKIFGKYWFGIDAPRQAVIFNAHALKRMLTETGYADILLETISVNAETYAMHSLDVAFNKWTYLNSESRVGKEVLPLLFQLIVYVINKITGRHGDECCATASKKG
jgi:SAM-dependent methyltransferase